MATALRGHLLLGFLSVFPLVIWAQQGARVSDAEAMTERLDADRAALESGDLPADDIPALAAWIVQDEHADLSLRQRVLSASVDAKLRHRLRLPASAEEDPHALLALALHPELAGELQQKCPVLPIALSTLCDLEQWSSFREGVDQALLRVLREPQPFAAASRVGGNDLGLQAADALCGMGDRGAALARRLLVDEATPRSQALGVMALGCAGGRELDSSEIQSLMHQSVSPAIRLAARLECAAQPGCVSKGPDTPLVSARDALEHYASDLQGGTP